MLDVAWMLGPYGFGSPSGLPEDVLLMAVSATLTAVGLAWLHHVLGMDEILGGARWRYRDRARIERLVRTIESLIEVPFTRTAGWWVTRIEFTLAGGALLAAIIVPIILPGTVGGGMSPGRPGAVLTLLGYAGIAFGIRWMRRIYLSPLEVDPEVGFRYRG